ncbi:hypothetical protein QMM96_22085 [Citrobacter freundii]|uniref:hypothetical protein n=1 Tax=Citrobacter freundii TaxID=546 RepID=UPI002B251C71|nr:hypothetical protein [Citrobacter freundii]MEB2478122.1 hypothetical protein [Citrobacter freundii]
MEDVKPASELEPRHIWIISRKMLVSSSNASELSFYVKRWEVVNETPKGYRVKYTNSEETTVFMHQKYHIFTSEKDALEFIADQANKIADILDKRKLTFTRLLCDAHDALRKFK